MARRAKKKMLTGVHDGSKRETISDMMSLCFNNSISLTKKPRNIPWDDFRDLPALRPFWVGGRAFLAGGGAEPGVGPAATLTADPSVGRATLHGGPCLCTS